MITMATKRVLMGVALGAVLVGSGVLFFAKTASVPAAGLESSALQTIAAPTFLAEYRNDANAVVLDVRTPAEFAEGHMKDAVLMDFYAPDFNEKIAQLDKDASYYVYCRSGNRSGKTLAMMRELGFTQVRDAAGGIGALEKAGADVVR